MRPAPLAACVALLLGCTAEPPRAPSSPPTVAPIARRSDAPTLDAVTLGEGDLTVVILHGFGATGDDLVPLAQELARSVPARYVVPAAPFALAGPQRMWWDIGPPPNVAQRDASFEAIEALLERERPRARRLVVGGFSQGAMSSVEIARRGRVHVDGVVALSGRALDDGLASDRDVAGIPMLVTHGRGDARIPFASGESLARDAQAAGAEVTFLPFDGGHAIPHEVRDAFVAFLRARGSR